MSSLVLASRSVVALVLFGTIASSCAGPGPTSGRADATAADILWLPENAVLQRDVAQPVTVKNGRSIYVDGSGAVMFSINSDRDEISRGIVEHFADTGWFRRPIQHLNPHLATSFERGWEIRGGGLIPQGKSPPYEPYYKWHGEWESERGEIVTYVLGGQGRKLHGSAEYLPRNLVESQRRIFGR